MEKYNIGNRSMRDVFEFADIMGHSKIQDASTDVIWTRDNTLRVMGWIEHPWVREHRALMMRYLRRPLKTEPMEYVLHVDGDNANNKLSNLTISSKMVL